MTLIMLQQLSRSTGENVGCLYINLDQITSITLEQTERHANCCAITLTDGKTYIAAQEVHEVLEEIRLANVRLANGGIC